jgi:segregation and condensation protein B
VSPQDDAQDVAEALDGAQGDATAPRGPGEPPGTPGASTAPAAAVEDAAGPEPEPTPDVEDAHADSGYDEDGTSEEDILEATLGAPTLGAALEAVLLVTDQPIDVASLAALVRRPADEVTARLRALAADYAEAGRGFDLREVAGGWRFYTRADCAEIVERYIRDGQQARLTQAALETLAVVAYRQPVSRARISAVRGVNVDGVIRTLTSRGLVAEAGHDSGTGAILYRTTELFLERLGLRNLDELPPVADYLPDIELLDDFIEQTSS